MKIPRAFAVGAGIAACAVIAVAAYFLWQSTSVPGSVDLGGLDQHRYFSDDTISDAANFARFVFWIGLASIVVQLAVLGVYARFGARWMRESAAGPIGTGMLLGMIGLAFVWLSQLPFGLLEFWWAKRHGLDRGSYVEAVFGQWPVLASAFIGISFALVVVMGLARWLGESWWIPGAAVFIGLGLLFTFLTPWLTFDKHRLRDPKLAAQARALEQREGLAPTPIDVQKVSDTTTAPNAFAAGMGPSRRIVVWNTFFDGRFTDREIRVVLAHEIGHLARSHLWKGIGWYALFAFPGAYLIARAARRRGGMGMPEAVPLAMFVLVVLSVFAIPLENAITRHQEEEADWRALVAARDPSAQISLFRKFGTHTLEEPNPGLVDYLLFENHPTLMQRIAMVRQWRERGGR
jgi:Zn-dependent protease with chaperone function